MPKRFDHTRPDFVPYGLTCEVWKPTRMPRTDRHNEVELNLLKEGRMTYLMGGRRVDVHGRRLAAFWAAVPHQSVEWLETTSYYVVTVPLAWMLSWELPAALVQALLGGELLEEKDDGSADLDFAMMARWQRDLSRRSSAGPEAMLLELRARFLRLASNMRRKPAARKRALAGEGSLRGERVERMATFIATNYTRRVTVPDVARAVGLHPDYAAALFKKAFGTTINSFIMQHRVSHAQRLLMTTEAKVLDVSMKSGFGSISRFNVAFKELCGSAPRQYRRSHRS